MGIITRGGRSCARPLWILWAEIIDAGARDGDITGELAQTAADLLTEPSGDSQRQNDNKEGDGCRYDSHLPFEPDAGCYETSGFHLPDVYALGFGPPHRIAFLNAECLEEGFEVAQGHVDPVLGK